MIALVLSPPHAFHSHLSAQGEKTQSQTEKQVELRGPSADELKEEGVVEWNERW